MVREAKATALHSEPTSGRYIITAPENASADTFVSALGSYKANREVFVNISLTF